MCRRFEVDLLKQGVDLCDFFRGKLSLRRLVILAVTLPRDSLVVKEFQRRELNLLPGEEAWTEQHALTAECFNALQVLIYLTQVNLWGKSKDQRDSDKPKPPEPLRPPGWKPPKPKIASGKQVFEMMKNNFM